MAGGERVGVLVAVRQEAEALLADPFWGWEPLEEGLWASRENSVLLRLTGVGKVFAAWACARLAPEVDLLLGLGTSGGLSDEAVGSLWLCPSFVERDMDASALWFEPGVTPFADMRGALLESAPDWLVERARAAAASAGIPLAGLATTASADNFVADPAAARAIKARTGARLCDMESAAVAKLALYRARKPFIALRAVSDNADHAARRSWEEQVSLSSRQFAAFLRAFVDAG